MKPYYPAPSAASESQSNPEAEYRVQQMVPCTSCGACVPEQQCNGHVTFLRMFNTATVMVAPEPCCMVLEQLEQDQDTCGGLLRACSGSRMQGWLVDPIQSIHRSHTSHLAQGAGLICHPLSYSRSCLSTLVSLD